jgi:hypothetical protein
MVSVEVEREIDHENKVILGMTVRQLICMGVAAVLAILIAALFGWNLNMALLPMGVVAAACCAFGWYKPNGETYEKYLFKLIRATLYRGNRRKYKTKNQYVTMMNEEYQRRRNMDLANKKIAKQIKKDSKKKLPKSQYKAKV